VLAEFLHLIITIIFLDLMNVLFSNNDFLYFNEFFKKYEYK